MRDIRVGDVSRSRPRSDCAARRGSSTLGGRVGQSLVVCWVLVWSVLGGSAATGHQFLSQSCAKRRRVRRLAEPGPSPWITPAATCSSAMPAAARSTCSAPSGVLVSQFGEGERSMRPVVAVDEATRRRVCRRPFEDAVEVFKPDGSGGYAAALGMARRACAGRGIRRSHGCRGR